MASLSLPLLVWLSPAFPVGAFAYSHGLEWAQEAGDVMNEPSLSAWIGDLLDAGAVRNDAILLAEAYRASSEDDAERLSDAAELALALCACAERRLEAAGQGNAFLATIAKVWPCDSIALLRRRGAEDVAYPVAVGVAAAGHGIPLDETLRGFALGFVSNLVSAAVRLGVVGQTDGQRVIAALMPAVEALAEASQGASLDDLGGCAFRSDLAALKHETQYTRLFRS